MDANNKKIIDDQNRFLKIKDDQILQLNSEIDRLKSVHGADIANYKAVVAKLEKEQRQEQLRSNSFERKLKESLDFERQDESSRIKIESLTKTIRENDDTIAGLKQRVDELQRGQIINPLENKIIVNMTLQRVDSERNPISSAKKRMIRLKFYNKSTDELILVKEEDPNSKDIDENDEEQMCTMQVCEKDSPLAHLD